MKCPGCGGPMTILRLTDDAVDMVCQPCSDKADDGRVFMVTGVKGKTITFQEVRPLYGRITLSQEDLNGEELWKGTALKCRTHGTWLAMKRGFKFASVAFVCVPPDRPDMLPVRAADPRRNEPCEWEVI